MLVFFYLFPLFTFKIEDSKKKKNNSIISDMLNPPAVARKNCFVLSAFKAELPPEIASVGLNRTALINLLLVTTS